MKAIWNNQVIAESHDTVVVEGNHYFPRSSLNEDFIHDSKHTSKCHWKGLANYFHLEVSGETNENAAWYYLKPLPMASKISDRVAFWKGVEIISEN
jgi:uncharacterized protein (DUF427 family)